MSGILSADLPAGWRRCHALGCGAPSGHEPPHVPEAVPPVAVAGPEVDVGAEVRGDAPTLAADLRIPDVIDVEAIADTWAVQWRALVEADPSTLTAGAMRRRAAMLEIAGHVRDERSTRAERIEAAARALLCEIERWQRVEVVGFGIPSAPLPIAALRAALCSCTGHGPDLACPEHGEALRAWQARRAP